MTLHPRYDEEYRDKAGTRHANDVALLARVADIRQGRADDALARFAKAYLGLFLDMDNSIAPPQRIGILANPELAAAINAGFAAVLSREDLPATAAIAASVIADKPLDIGYVLLAGMNELARHDAGAVVRLPATTLAAAICFHYANKTDAADVWLDGVLTQHPALAAATLQQFWQTLIAHDFEYLPGLEQILARPGLQPVAREVVIPILQHWRNCRKKVLREILLTALQLADQASLRQVIESALVQWNPNEPGRYAQWLAAAFLLSPANYTAVLTDYMGRSRERILPLLDFVALALQRDTAQRYELPASAFASLLQVIAARFSPQVDRFGNLCDNSIKLMYLFYRLATARDAYTAAEIKSLRQIRVMKLYDAILAQALLVHTSGTSPPAVDDFIASLQAKGCIKSKCNWSDQR